MRYIPGTRTRSKIFNAMDDIKIINHLIYQEHKDIEQYYAGHSIQYHMAYLLETSINTHAWRDSLRTKAPSSKSNKGLVQASRLTTRSY